MDLPKILDVPNVQQQFDWDCGPSCIETVTSYFGEQGTSAEFAKLMGTDVNNGTDPSAMCHMLNQLGLNYEDRDDLQIQDLQHYIEQGQPIIAAIQDYEETPTDIVTQRAGHWVVVIGADAENVYLQDPSAYETNGRVVMPALEFLARWQDYAGIIPDNDTQYVHYGIAVSGSLEQGVKSMEIKESDFWNPDNAVGWPKPSVDWSTASLEQMSDGQWAIVMDGRVCYTFALEHVARATWDMLTNHSGIAWEGYGWRQHGKTVRSDYVIYQEDGVWWFIDPNATNATLWGPYDSYEEAERYLDRVVATHAGWDDNRRLGLPFLGHGENYTLRSRPMSHAMDINDVALQFCGLLRIGKKASPQVMGMLRRSLKEEDGILYAVDGTAHSADYSAGYRDGYGRKPAAQEGNREYMAGFYDGELDANDSLRAMRDEVLGSR